MSNASVAGTKIFITTPVVRSERCTEREQHQALLVLLLGVEREADLDAQRPERREPAQPETDGVAQVAEIDAVVVRECVAGVEEDHTLDAGVLDDREDQLVV